MLFTKGRSLIVPVLAVAASLAGVAHADFVSPFPSMVEGIDIPNTILLSGSMEPGRSAVLRGMAPRDMLPQLLEQGITDVVIFKNETGTEVRQEMRELLKAGFKDKDGDGIPDRAHHFPFKWRGFGDAEFTENCEMTLDALNVIFDAYSVPGRKVFFHCTVGEDRTGLLAGLFRSLEEEIAPGQQKQWSIRGSFYWEMCEGGYGAGNPEKAQSSPYVVTEIDKALTPFYTKMGYLIEKGLITRELFTGAREADEGKTLDKSICRRDPKFDPELRQDFLSNSRYNHFKYRCRASSRYPYDI